VRERGDAPELCDKIGGFAADACEFSQGFHDYLLSAAVAADVYAIRLAVVSTLPVFLLAGRVGRPEQQAVMTVPNMALA